MLLEGPSRCPVEDEVEDVLESVGAAERPQHQNQDPHVEDALVGCFGGLRSGLHQVHLEEGPEGLNYFDGFIHLVTDDVDTILASFGLNLQS